MLDKKKVHTKNRSIFRVQLRFIYTLIHGARRLICGSYLQCPLKCRVATVQRSVSCSRVDEAGNLSVVADVFCRYLVKPFSKAKCNDDHPCKRELLFLN